MWGELLWCAAERPVPRGGSRTRAGGGLGESLRLAQLPTCGAERGVSSRCQQHCREAAAAAERAAAASRRCACPALGPSHPGLGRGSRPPGASARGRGPWRWLEFAEGAERGRRGGGERAVECAWVGRERWARTGVKTRRSARSRSPHAPPPPLPPPPPHVECASTALFQCRSRLEPENETSQVNQALWLKRTLRRPRDRAAEAARRRPRPATCPSSASPAVSQHPKDVC